MHKQTCQGILTMVDKWPGIFVSQANEIVGGKVVGKLNAQPVAAIVQHGKGTVMAVGFSSLFIDKNMGGAAMWMVEPDAAMLLRYDILYKLVGLLVENKPIVPTPSTGEDSKTKSQIPLNLPDLPSKELGPQ
jgi:hypothetical protein